MMKLTRLMLSLLLLVVLLFVAGCSSTVKSTSKDPNMTAIKTVLEHQFTGPDSEFIEGTENTEKLEEYYEKRYKSYFTEERYNSFIAASAYTYVLLAYNNDKEIKAEKVDVRTEEGWYHFNVTVSYGEAGNGQNSAEVTGKAKINDDGKITNVQYLNDGGLTSNLEN
ncbi:hypothetical protein [Mesobacillus jeotgali]|uniref:hypothetical protein n=1 Tax=Mesobacillus jeotgali TaxID=129985 RepID=UPI0009A7F62C|nr:hypothetical protein [Mesobacillus jeotgali]